MIKRLSIATVLLIKENPVLPISFKFEGKCLLEQLKAEREAYKEGKREPKRPKTRSSSKEKHSISASKEKKSRNER